MSTGSSRYLGVSSIATSHDKIENKNTCKGLPLDTQQVQVCKKHPDSILCISTGARQGIYECQYQFQHERWNCTTTKNQTVFGTLLDKGTKETAFIYAILSAGVVHAVTQACSAGNLTECSCDLRLQGQKTEDGWTWGGCSDNVDYGVWFGKTFVDAPDTSSHKSGRNVRMLMNLHNNEVGRKAIVKQMRRQCRCHGVSGSCAVKTCWKGLPPFRQIGNYLKTKYEHSVQVAPRSKRKLRRRERVKRKVPIPVDILVHLHRSPNFCRADAKQGIPGTRGRMCNKNSRSQDSCDLLCCGRGYNTQVKRHSERCHCKFVWCCYVKCQTCVSQVDIHTCK
ncbi:protein Wnt-16 isoform X2 [Lingula anatina]|uniref:Protein Wnt n=1 Tax=Lingula anatina TaxID=7574 RepID=A0A1S3IAL6_LINAN|nr:protein Wnt-16 isoform X2 [Lingula anatina]|eukprot:XP_013395208.1 protein Wnt-16 isoform X2 [Lingula anatina]